MCVLYCEDCQLSNLSKLCFKIMTFVQHATTYFGHIFQPKKERNEQKHQTRVFFFQQQSLERLRFFFFTFTGTCTCSKIPQVLLDRALPSTLFPIFFLIVFFLFFIYLLSLTSPYIYLKSKITEISHSFSPIYIYEVLGPVHKHPFFIAV